MCLVRKPEIRTAETKHRSGERDRVGRSAALVVSSRRVKEGLRPETRFVLAQNPQPTQITTDLLASA